MLFNQKMNSPSSSTSEQTSFAGVERVVAGNSLNLRHHAGFGKELVPVDVVHRVLEGDLLHAVCLLEQSTYNNPSSFCAFDEKHIGFKLQSCPHIEQNCNCIEPCEN